MMTLERVVVPAEEIRVGDFTHFAGFKRVQRVDLHPRRRDVRIYWTRGGATLDYGTPVKVAREPEESPR